MTQQIRVDDLNPQSLAGIARTLEATGVVCFPTDTVYAIGVDPTNPVALERLFKIKERPFTKPILLLVDSIELARTVVLPNPVFEEVAAAFWPGPLTLVSKSRENLLSPLTAGSGAVGVRFPKARIPCELVGAFGGALTGTSANRSGQPAARSASEVVRQLGSSVDIIVDGGTLNDSPPSTILDVSNEPAVLLREGPITCEALRRLLNGHLRRLA